MFSFLFLICVYVYTCSFGVCDLFLFSLSLGSIDEALWFLEKCVRDAAQRDEAMGEILVPIIEHVIS